MLLGDDVQRGGLTAALKRVALQRQKLPLSTCDKDLERAGAEEAE